MRLFKRQTHASYRRFGQDFSEQLILMRVAKKGLRGPLRAATVVFEVVELDMTAALQVGIFHNDSFPDG